MGKYVTSSTQHFEPYLLTRRTISFPSPLSFPPSFPYPTALHLRLVKSQHETFLSWTSLSISRYDHLPFLESLSSSHSRIWIQLGLHSRVGFEVKEGDHRFELCRSWTDWIGCSWIRRFRRRSKWRNVRRFSRWSKRRRRTRWSQQRQMAS